MKGEYAKELGCAAQQANCPIMSKALKLAWMESLSQPQTLQHLREQRQVVTHDIMNQYVVDDDGL